MRIDGNALTLDKTGTGVDALKNALPVRTNKQAYSSLLRADTVQG